MNAIVAIGLTLVTFLIFAFLGSARVGNLVVGTDANHILPFGFLNVHFTIWFCFYFGLSSVGASMLQLRGQKAYFAVDLLNREEHGIYDKEDRDQIYQRTSKLPAQSIVRQMILRALAQYQVSRSWSHANEVLQATALEQQGRVELSYTLVRYLTWLVPTLGFVGTVLGIANALEFAGGLVPEDFQDGGFLATLVQELGLAFSTTFMALILSGILIFVASLTQSAEERFITDVFADCVDNLLNKLHEDS